MMQCEQPHLDSERPAERPRPPCQRKEHRDILGGVEKLLPTEWAAGPVGSLLGLVERRPVDDQALVREQDVLAEGARAPLGAVSRRSTSDSASTPALLVE